MNNGPAVVSPRKATTTVVGAIVGHQPGIVLVTGRVLVPRQVRVTYRSSPRGDRWVVHAATVYGPLLTVRTLRPSVRESATRAYAPGDPQTPHYVREFIAHYLPRGVPYDAH